MNNRARLSGVGSALLLLAGCMSAATISVSQMGVTFLITLPTGTIPKINSTSTPTGKDATLTIPGLTVKLKLTKPDDPNSPRQLTLNDEDFGTVDFGDTVSINQNTVSVNGVARSPVKR